MESLTNGQEGPSVGVRAGPARAARGRPRKYFPPEGTAVAGSSGQSTTVQPRKRKKAQPIAEDKKDEKYWKRRKTNSEASRLWRLKVKEKEKEMDKEDRDLDNKLKELFEQEPDAKLVFKKQIEEMREMDEKYEEMKAGSRRRRLK